MMATTLNKRRSSARPKQQLGTDFDAIPFLVEAASFGDEKKSMSFVARWTNRHNKSKRHIAVVPSCFLSFLVCCWLMPSLLSDEGCQMVTRLLTNSATRAFFFPAKERIFPRLVQLQLNRNSDRTKRDASFSVVVIPTLSTSSTTTSAASALDSDGTNTSKSSQRERHVTPMISKVQAKHLERSDDYKDEAAEPFETRECKAQYSWQLDLKPSCNVVHEYDMTKVQIINSGYWRDVWVKPEIRPKDQEAVLKTQRYEHDFSGRNMDRNRRDAVALEHFTSSPWILNVYSFCTTSSVFEYAPNGSIEDKIWPEESEDSPDINYEAIPLDFLRYAVQAAVAVAAMHNFDKEGRPSIAHTDISPSQFVLTTKGQVKLNDFNRARFIRENRKTKEICTYTVGNNPGTNRSPEEYAYQAQTEKVDMYSLGNIFYMLVAREWPFENTKEKIAMKAIMKGQRPRLPTIVQNTTNPIIRILIEAMQMCHRQDPEQRATSREVEKFLKAEIQRLAPGKLQEWGIDTKKSLPHHVLQSQ
ncbi:hypothetical protein ACA910_001354 [Epithemia clementina (nom. ined.)]